MPSFVPVSLFRRLARPAALAAALLVGIAAPAAPLAPSAAPAAIDLRGLPLLFADDAGLVSSRDLVRTVHPARPAAGPVLEGERPWEGPRIYAFGSVYHDAALDRYRMWYLSVPHAAAAGLSETDRAALGRVPSLRGSGYFLVLYAESVDGVKWTRPDLGLHAYAGSAANNIVFDLNSPSILLDRFEKDPAKRYKMLGTLHHDYYAAWSPDGLRWTAASPDPVLPYSDTINLTQDPATGEYLAYHKRPAVIRGFDRRVVWLSRSRDFLHWSEPVLVFAPDEADDDWTRRAGERTEVYDMTVLPHAGGYLGLPVIFRMMEIRPRERMGPAQSPWAGPLDVQLATSADGVNWRRSWPRVAVVPRGAPGTFDGGGILNLSSTAVHTADETWVYYTAMATGHGAPIPPKRMTIGRAVWRLHGFASLDAGPEGGRLETRPLRFATPELWLNADAARGALRVALLEADGTPIPGYALEDSAVLQADSVRWIPRWKERTGVPVDRPVRLVVEMSAARLYSLGGASAP